MFVVMKREKAIKDETDDTKALYRKIKMVAVLMFVVSIIVIGGLMLYCFYSRM
jgi:magnesium-transporting ATPase (P-type)